jgi:regulator of protease activity HflC (stomatin/prohibitin superfamily)
MGHSKKLEYTALIGLVLQLLFAGTFMIVASQSRSRAAEAEMWQLVIGALVWFVVLVHGRQRRLAADEQEEMARLKESRLSEEIFQETELDAMRASSGLRVLERYLVPLFTLVLSGLLLFFGWRIASSAWGVPAPAVTRPSMVAIAAIFVAFPGFLIGRYSAGLAQSEGFGLLRAAGGYVLGNVIGLILIAISMALLYFDVSWAEVAVTFIIPVIMALVGVELVLNLILDIYRPRVPGRERRPPYDSRILGLFAEPQGVLKTVAATLDYQFGFKVSDTWFYHFMEKAILPLLLVEVVSLWLLTMIVVVNPNEVAFVEVFSEPYLTQADNARGLYATVLEPGFHWKWPWPFAVARHVPAYEIQSIAVGKIYKDEAAAAKDAGLSDVDDVSLWKESHIRPGVAGEEASFLVPSTARVSAESIPVVGVEGAAKAAAAPEVNLARLLAHVQYRVKQKPDGTIDEQSAFTYTFRQTDIQRHMEELSYRALCRIAASQDFLRWIAQDRAAVVARLRDMIQEGADREKLGLEVVFVGMTAVHPPMEAATAYEGVVKAMEDKESLIYQGQTESERTIQDAKAQEKEIVNSAMAVSAVLRTAEASKNQFLVQLDAYMRSPLVYEYRAYFDTLETVLQGQRLYVAPSTTNEVDIIDMTVTYTQELLKLNPGK